MDLTLIGERLNTHREEFAALVAERDAENVRKEALRQQAAGTTHLDVNTSANPEKELADMLWVLETILPVLRPEMGIVLDSGSAECLGKALWLLKGRSHTIINAVSNDAQRLAAIVPLVVQHNTSVVAVLSAGVSVQRSPGERLGTAQALHQVLCEAGVDESRQYYDPQILPLAFDPRQPVAVLEAIREIRRRWPAVHVVAGLSNISFNMPERALLNRTFLAMLLAAGADTFILDPCGRQARKTMLAARALLGLDEFLAAYLSEIGPG